MSAPSDVNEEFEKKMLTPSDLEQPIPKRDEPRSQIR